MAREGLTEHCMKSQHPWDIFLPVRTADTRPPACCLEMMGDSQYSIVIQLYRRGSEE